MSIGDVTNNKKWRRQSGFPSAVSLSICFSPLGKVIFRMGHISACMPRIDVDQFQISLAELGKVVVKVRRSVGIRGSHVLLVLPEFAP